jgi:GntR family transcriptional regulator / MocR family aminotransferase
VTPSHQFPTGAILPIARRLALLEWAKRENSVIVEDDYDGEFRYEGQPLESLQGLDPEGRILYVGTFSRTMFPALRGVPGRAEIANSDVHGSEVAE